MKGQGIVQRVLLTAAGLCLGFMVLTTLAESQSFPVDILHTWENGELEGWMHDGADGVILLNSEGSLTMRFAAQEAPFLVNGMAGVDLPYPCVATNITFTLQTGENFPSALRLYIHASTSGRSWYMPLTVPEAQAALTYYVPVEWGAGWVSAPGATKEQFYADAAVIDSAGIYIRRHSDTRQQDYHLEQFALHGWTGHPRFRLGGRLTFENRHEGGKMYISVGHAPGDFDSSFDWQADARGYEAYDIPAGGPYYVQAFLDQNGNGYWDFWEPRADYAGGAITLLQDRSDVDMVFRDPVNEQGVPYWWLFETGLAHLRTPWKELQALGVTDSDGDGMTDYEEYLAGTDPLNAESNFELRFGMVNLVAGGEQPSSSGGHIPTAPELRWPAAKGRTYTVWRSRDLTKGFEVLQSGIKPTPPENVFRDDSFIDGPTGGYFYKVTVEVD